MVRKVNQEEKLLFSVSIPGKHPELKNKDEELDEQDEL